LALRYDARLVKVREYITGLPGVEDRNDIEIAFKAGRNWRSPIGREDSSGGASHKMQSSRLAGHQHRPAVDAGTGEARERVCGKNRRMGKAGKPAEPVASAGGGQRFGGTRSFAGRRSEKTREPGAGLVLDRRFEPEDALHGETQECIAGSDRRREIWGNPGLHHTDAPTQ